MEEEAEGMPDGPAGSNHLEAFHHLGITVSSLERSLGFYRDVLGFEEVFRWNPKADYIGTLVGYPEVDLHAVVLRLPGSSGMLELLEYRDVDGIAIDTRNGNPGTCHIAFFVTMLDTLYKRLKSHGVDSVSTPVTPTIGPNRGGRAVYMIDPDGVRVELIETAGTFEDFASAERC
jgi:lactoylglutathione lyase